ncbi:hypothetical protein [Mycobacterium haemophilum]|uniref:Membrane protein n=1 Tax=Mycobacterium haemophilum TaxID=29311 RepID=A0A0I9UNN8_9MYCO|nr:hypothetical protein [Mycobacterium haemophilum]AKN18303.1 hypothetical protein B586_19715 [Mycobacterium haemophilum DSM 44634]KLO33129.1 membrane protein [Mycobacterium haemophilum]KLO38084.1 membrane protein [Mycobacterium haemophilum]KLO44406.1 membrane protein [Mycobacterium haemophilum]KLO49582.1 membrane protein [Mycobacterium haemophilum]
MADKDVDQEREPSPGTEPFVPDFDTGEESVPFVPDFSDIHDTGAQPLPLVIGPEKSDPVVAGDEDVAAESAAAPVTVPGRYQYLKWWKLVLVILGVWIAAAEVGLSLFYWWYHTIDKTAPVFMVLVYVVGCTVAGVLLAMVPGKPLIAALALAVMSGPFASVAAAAPLYGYYYCERVGHCVVGVIPY